MKIIKYWCVLLLLCLATASFSQHQFKVLNSAGNVRLEENGEKTDLLTGTSLNGEISLVLDDNAYIGLISDNGKTLELREKGTYSLEDLNRLADEKESSSLTAKYAEYLLNGNSARIIGRLEATGAVERASRTEKNSIALNLPEKSVHFNDRLLISWQGDASKEYQVHVTDLYDKKLSTLEVTGIETEIDLSAFAEIETVLVQIQLSSKKKYSEKVALQRLSEKERQRHETALASLEKVNESALDVFLTGIYFAENGLYADAFSCFTKAVKLAPDVATYNNMYNQWFALNTI